MNEKIIKYLKTIFLWILIVGFIISVVSFINNINSFIKPAKIEKNPTNESFISQAKKIETELNDLTENLKDTYGENYPALGIIYYKTILHYSSTDLVRNFLFELIAGFALGNIIYFVFIEKFTKYKLFIVLTIGLFVTSIFLGLSDILINCANNELFEFNFDQIILNMVITSIPYTIISLMLIAVQKIYSTFIEIRYS